MTNQPSKIEDEIEKILALVQLSENLTDATNKNIDEIAELVYLKFDMDFDYMDFASQIDEIKNELTGNVKELKEKYGGNPYDINKMKNELDRNKELLLHLKNMLKTKKIIDELKTNFDFEDENLEFASKVANLIPGVISMRARKDIIPLIHRGVYSEDIKNALTFWRENELSERGKLESTWQQELTQRKAILERVIGGRVSLLHTQAHVGSDGLNGKGDKITDYMFHHTDTRNVTLVEIKTPHTILLGKTYRNTYALSEDLSGTVAQVLTQRVELTKHFFSKAHTSTAPFEFNAPKCYIVVGNIRNELGTDEQKIRAFEMHRQAVSSAVTIITFDELYDQFAKFNVAT